jgi:hypothetical protein
VSAFDAFEDASFLREQDERGTGTRNVNLQETIYCCVSFDLSLMFSDLTGGRRSECDTKTVFVSSSCLHGTFIKTPR